MKISKRVKNSARHGNNTIAERLFIFDEYYQATGTTHALSAPVAFFDAEKREPAMIATQAVVTRNSGKKIRFISYVKLANGDPVTPAPKKFLPTQVLRRQSQS